MVFASSNAKADPRTRLIAGKYRLIRPLGRGGMASVWQAEHLTLHSPVAVKLLEATIAASSLALQRFLREARATAALRSPHVVQILDHGVDEGTPYIVMEQLEGESLAERLEQVPQLSPQQTARIVTHIARALSRAHDAGIVHRDLKPENVFLVRNDDEEVAKLLDFGIAKSLHEGEHETPMDGTIPGMIVGTPYYMSPEQAGAAPNLDHRSDIWALGVIAFECLLGRRPFEGHTLHDLLVRIRESAQPVPSELGAVPPGFDAWFARACAREVGDRFESAKEAADALRLVCEEGLAPKRAEAETKTTLVSGRTEPARRRPERRALLSLAFVSAVLLLAFALGRASFSGTDTAPSNVAASTHAALPASAPPRVPSSNANTEPTVVPIVEPEAPSALPSASSKPAPNARRAAPPAAPRPHPLTEAPPQPTATSEPRTAPAPRRSVDLGI